MDGLLTMTLNLRQEGCMLHRQSKTFDAKQFYNTREAAAHYLQKKELLPKEVTAFRCIPQNAKILDLGCGTGRTTEVLIKRGYQVIGGDISFRMIQAAKHQDIDTPLLVNDACSLSFRAGEFDVLVFSGNGIDFIYPYEKRLKALYEIKRVLRPGGLFIFSSHNHCIPRDKDGLKPFLKTLLKKRRNVYMDSHYCWGAAKVYLSSPSLQIAEIERVGFKLIKLIPRRLLKDIKALGVIGLIDSYVYYVCRSL